MNKIELYSSVLFAILIFISFFWFKSTGKLSKILVVENPFQEIEKKISNFQNQIENINKSLISLDENIQEISFSIKKLVRIYREKEQDLKEEFKKIQNERQNKIFEEYQKKLLIEMVEIAAAEIMLDSHMQNRFTLPSNNE